MSSCYGEKLNISIFGQSHSAAIGVSIGGLPAGLEINMDNLQRFMRRRAPGQNNLSTPRSESDTPEVLSGLVNGKTCGAPLAIIIRNTNTRSADYDELRDIPRPAHADYTAYIKYGGYADVAGGGHFSGRLTAPLCAAGGIALQALRTLGIHIGAHIKQIGAAQDESFDAVNVSAKDFALIEKNELPVINTKITTQMRSEILSAKECGDSIGGIIECAAVGLPIGLGEPMFGGMENRISQIVFGIPAVKGIEFGSGFAGALQKGSQNNDSFYMDGDSIKTRTNNCGGILGGITNGMPLLFSASVKATPSIAMQQNSISLSRRQNTLLNVKGRHDPCIVPRAVPCIEAAAAIAIYDAYLI